MSEAELPPPSLGGYRWIARIARGGMGEVWRAERVGAGGVRRRVAIKRILPEFQREAMLRERFVAEARITARLEHPNIVQLIDFGDTPELYLVLEYVDGIALAELMRRALTANRPLPVTASLYIVAEAATGLDYAHRRKDDDGRALEIVHRDVSPPNILVSVDGTVKVNDFGIARAADNLFRTQAGLAVGKLVYMSPEQARGERVDRRADVWALGVVLWESLVLRPLFPRDNPGAALEAAQRGAITPPSAYVPNLPPGIDEIVMGALTVDPEKRTSSAGRLASALRGVLHHLAPGYDSRDIARLLADLAPEIAARSGGDPMTPAFPAPEVGRVARNSAPSPDALAPTMQVPPTPMVDPAALEAMARGNQLPMTPGPLTPERDAKQPAQPARAPEPARTVVAPLASAQGAPNARAHVAPNASAASASSARSASAASSGAHPLPATRAVPIPSMSASSSPSSSSRAWLWWLVGAVLLVAVGGGLFAWRAMNVDDAGSGATTDTATLNAAVGATTSRLARQCADQLSLSGVRVASGVVTLDAFYANSGLPSTMTVRVANSGRDVEVAQCLEQALRSNPVVPPPAAPGAAVSSLVVTF